MSKEAMKLALEALEETLRTLDDENAKPGGAIADTIWYSPHETLFDYLAAQIIALREALAEQPTTENSLAVEQPAQPQQEPDDSLFRNRVRVHLANRNFYSHSEFCKKLEVLWHETPPAQRKPLTDEQIVKMIPNDPAWDNEVGEDAAVAFARAIEAAHGIKGDA